MQQILLAMRDLTKNELLVVKAEIEKQLSYIKEREALVAKLKDAK